jgi:predicted patatin/cPLA2 family phospholipase
MTENATENKKSKIEQESFQAEKVVQDLFKIKTEREKGIEPKSGPLLIIGGGGQRGPFGGGGVVALSRLGLVNAFKTVVGVSTGAPTASFFLSEQAEIGCSIYYNENIIDNSFLDLRREEGQPIMDIDWLCDVFKNGNSNGEKKLDVQTMKGNPSELYYAVTDVENGLGKLLKASDLEDPIDQGIKASCAVPGLYDKEVPVSVGGVIKTYVDGGVALPMPIVESFQIHKPTSVVVFANRPKKFEDTFFNKLVSKYKSLVVKTEFADEVLNNDKIFEDQIKFLKNSGVPYIIFWTDNSLKPIDKRKEKLENAARNFEAFVFNFINQFRKKE